MTVDTGLGGRTVIVAGAGGGGIGTAVCVAALAAQGAVVAGLDVDPDKLAITERAVAAAGGTLRSVNVDLRDPTAVQRCVHDIAASTRDLHGLVVVAGGLPRQHWAALADTPADQFDEVLRLNLLAATYATQAVGRHLLAAGRPGAIVHIQSIASQALPFGVAYGAAKAGLASVMRTAALEWGHAGIRVNAVAAGPVRTPRATEQSDDPPETTVVIPLRRRGLPSEIADGVVFLLSDQARWITGQLLVVDGGASIRPGMLDEHLLPVFMQDPSFRARLLE